MAGRRELAASDSGLGPLVSPFELGSGPAGGTGIAQCCSAGLRAR